MLTAFNRMVWFLKRLNHPVIIFVGLQIVWIAFIVLWVFWLINANQEIAKLAHLLGNARFDNGISIVVLVLGIVFLTIILLGTVLLFIFGLRQSRLYTQQQNFVSSVTHELRSPLASLKLALETLVERKIDPQIQEKIYNMMLEDAERLSRLVNQILVSSRLDRGIAGFEHEGFADVRKVIDSTVASLSFAYPNLNSRLVIHCEDNLTIHLAEQALSLILGNLVENALKFSSKDSKVTLHAFRSHHATQIKVCDQGIGFESREKNRVFRMFQRGNLAIKKAIPGTGLGLFIVKSIVRLASGKVWIESPGVNQGSTVNVLIPNVNH